MNYLNSFVTQLQPSDNIINNRTVKHSPHILHALTCFNFISVAIDRKISFCLGPVYFVIMNDVCMLQTISSLYIRLPNIIENLFSDCSLCKQKKILFTKIKK